MRLKKKNEETTVTQQQASHRPIKCQSRSSWSQRGTKVNGSRHGDSPLPKPLGIQIATKPLPGPISRGHWKLIGVKTMSLGTIYSFYCLECYKLQRKLSDVCPTNKVVKSGTKHFLALGGLQGDKLCDILQAMTPTNVEAVHQTFLFHFKSNPDRVGLLSPTHGQRSQQQRGQITLQSVLINKPKFLIRPHIVQKQGKLKYRGPWWWRS